MSDQTVNQDDDLSAFTEDIAGQIQAYVAAVAEVARGDSPDSAVSVLLLEVSQLLLAGGRLGAIADVIPHEQYEPDAGYEPDADTLREDLAALLAPIDEYAEVFDPYADEPEVIRSRLSDDLADVALDLIHGLTHYGGPAERGAVVVAVLLPEQLGSDRKRGAARVAVGRRARPARRPHRRRDGSGAAPARAGRRGSDRRRVAVA